MYTNLFGFVQWPSTLLSFSSQYNWSHIIFSRSSFDHCQLCLAGFTHYRLSFHFFTCGSRKTMIYLMKLWEKWIEGITLELCSGHKLKCGALDFLKLETKFVVMNDGFLFDWPSNILPFVLMLIDFFYISCPYSRLVAN